MAKHQPKMVDPNKTDKFKRPVIGLFKTEEDDVFGHDEDKIARFV
jgi:hypothetical protein